MAELVLQAVTFQEAPGPCYVLWWGGYPLPRDQRAQKQCVIYHADLHAGSVFLNWNSDTYIPLPRSS